MVKARILVVEDESVVAKDIQDTLRGLDYSVSGVTSSGEEAIKKAEETRPDLVLMDIVLKGKTDGVEAARQIRERFGIPVVYLTAYADNSTLGRAKVTGPYGYILKPFEEGNLHTAIQVALYKHGLERKIREETENALATIIGGTELILDEGAKKHDRETLRKVELIRNAAYIVKETIEKL